MQDEIDKNLNCPICKVKFSLCKSWDQGKWVYWCFTKGCDYRKEVEITREESEEFNGGS